MITNVLRANLIASPETIRKFLIVLTSFLVLIFVCDVATAQTIAIGTGSTPGNDAWTALKSVWFGPMGLIFGCMVFAVAVYYFFKEGVLATCGVLAVGTFFFFIPALAISVQTWAKSF